MAVAHLTEADMVREAIAANEKDPTVSPEFVQRQREQLKRYETGGRDKWTGSGGDTGHRERSVGNTVRAAKPDKPKVWASQASLDHLRRMIDRKLPEGDPLREPVLKAWAGEGPKGRLTQSAASALIDKLNEIKVPEPKATDPQKNKIRQLMPTRITAEAIELAEQGIDKMTKSGASALITHLLKLPQIYTPATPVQTRQVDPSHVCEYDYNVIPGKSYCRGCNTSLESRQAAKPALTDGIYKDPATGTIYKAQYNKAQGDGTHLYAKKMAGVEEVVARGGGLRNKITWEYAGAATHRLKPEWKLSAEDATAFGKLYGICIYCGAELTDEESIERAVGRICWGKHHG
jgi:hypothetical protein